MADRMTEITLHIKFGKKDADLVYWKSFVPQSSFSQYVRQILLAEKRKTVAILPVPPERGFEYKTMDTKVYLYGRSEVQFINSIPKGKRSAAIRSIIRKHVNANYIKNGAEELPNPRAKQETPLSQTAATATAQVEMEEDEFDDVSEEYRNLLRGISG